MGKRAPSQERTVLCVVCGSQFQTRHSQGKYCSPEHQREGERSSWRKYGRKNKEERSAYHSVLYLRNRDRILARTSAYHKTDAGKAAHAISDARQAEKFPDKIAARQAILIAKRSGRLKQADCERCGDKNTQAHHPDYSKPLEVIWLCRTCHDIEHGRSAVARRHASPGQLQAVRK